MHVKKMLKIESKFHGVIREMVKNDKTNIKVNFKHDFSLFCWKKSEERSTKIVIITNHFDRSFRKCI